MITRPSSRSSGAKRRINSTNAPALRRSLYGVDYDAGRLDETKLNPWGSSIAYGHPFGATVLAAACGF